ncbi:PREDICTED: uncharacterized protein LOC104732042 [Camelina sativa]|uniref:Uncharacterized protein LOC104732042 n=1 Tax=Camelina sativa TaxID=90675 RepID=A0ABM0V2L8_CAMSA|nr:PREDICTED: uncharacterized protein LOC104732042 [Camelina sativa]
MEILNKMYTLIRSRGLKCDGCNLGKDYHSDGYRCFHSGVFFHKECANSDLEINNRYHPQHSFHIKAVAENEDVYGECKVCRGDWKCGVCHKMMIWTFGAFTCLKYPNLSIHLRCATRFRIWDGTELEGIPENILEVKSYEPTEEGTITHFSHLDHTLKLNEENDTNDKCRWCKAYLYPIYF